jgi:CubicO group peptidase (beta-lactamase class C family)
MYEMFKIAPLQSLLNKVRNDSNLVSFSVSFFVKDKFYNIAVGERKRDTGMEVHRDDVYQLGSVSKIFTATVAAKLVENKFISWSTTLGDVFPEISMHDSFTTRTLEDLLCHQSSMIRDGDYTKRFLRTHSYMKNRIEYLINCLEESINTEKSVFNYSNAGYVAASMMLERVTRKSWFQLLKENIFQPLELNTASLGASWPKIQYEQVLQPWPHRIVNHILQPVKPTPKNVDCPNDFGAGLIRMSMSDLCRFLNVHVRGARGESDFLSKSTFEYLHRNRGFEYGLGVFVYERAWAQGNALSHSGDDGFSSTVFWLAPSIEFGICVSANESRSITATVLDDIVGVIFDFIRIDSLIRS